MSREQIARAVLDVGFPALTFAAVRQRLGVGETTLFRYAPDRDALVRFGLERIIDTADWPSCTGPWRVMLSDYAFVAWHSFAAHPGSALEVSRGIVPDGIMRLLEDLCAALVRGGFSATNAVLACDLVFDLVADNRRGVESFDTVTAGTATPRERLSRTLTATASAPVASTTPAVSTNPGSSTNPALSSTDPNDEDIRTALLASIVADPLGWFSAKLDVVLTGIAHSLAPARG